MASNQLPDILKVGPLQRPVNQVVSTDILQPTTFSQNYAKFVFDKKGILDSNSQLHVSQIVVNSDRPTTDTKCYYPTATGALALITRAYLTIGGREISDLREVGQYNTWKRHHYSNAYKEGVAIPHQSGNDVFVGSAGIPSATNTATDKRARGFSAPYGVIGRESSEYGSNYNISTNTFNTWGQQNTRYTFSDDKAKRLIPWEPSRSPAQLIALAQLCPVLVGLQLPLFAINQEVALHIEWAPNTWGHRFMYNREDAGGGAVNRDNCKSTILEDECFIVMDTLFYPGLMGEIEDQIMSRGGYSIPYDDVITQTNFLQYDETSGITSHDFQIPLAGKRIKRIIVQKALELTAVVQSLTCGYYNSVALRTGIDYNFRIDSKNVYSLALKNVALQRQEADETEGIPMVLSSSLYSFFNQADQTTGVMTLPNDSNITNRLCNSHIQNNETGKQNWLGLKIENMFGQGHLMGIQPVIYTETGKLTGDDDGTGVTPNKLSDRTVRFFCLYQKIMNINNGLVEVID